jgi:hypothetical protein
VTDIAIKNEDVVISTQGRSFWILDDISPMRQMTREAKRAEVHLFEPAPAHRVGWDRVRVHYRLGEGVEGPVRIAFLDAQGEEIQSFGKAAGPETGAVEEHDEDEWWGGDWGQGDKVPAKEGLNAFEWNMRYEGPTSVPGAVGWPPAPRQGPMVAPGVYTVRLTVGETTLERPFEVRPDPVVDTSPEGYETQVAMLLEIRDVLSDVNEGVNTIRFVRKEIDATVERYKRATEREKRAGTPAADEAPAPPPSPNGAGEPGHDPADGSTIAGRAEDVDADTPLLIAQAESIREQLKAIEEALIQTKSKSPQDPLNFPVMLNDKLAALVYTVESSFEPTDSSRRVLDRLSGIAREKLADLDRVLAEDVSAFNDLAAEVRVPAVVLPPDDGEADAEIGSAD